MPFAKHLRERGRQLVGIFALLCTFGFCRAAFPSRLMQAQERRLDLTQRNIHYAVRSNALEAIVAVGLQTHTPIGIVPGRNTTSLCQSQYSFDLRDMDGPMALLDIARRTQYSLTEKDGVFILTAPDTTPRQLEVLNHRFAEFKPGAKQTMHMLTFQLSGWLWTEVAHGEGYGGSIMDNPDAPTVSLPLILKNISTTGIANRIVTLGKGGMWISKISPDNSEKLDDISIEFESYGDPDQLKRDISCAW